MTGTVKVMSKSMLGNDLVELCENGNRSKWFVVTKEIPISVRCPALELKNCDTFHMLSLAVKQLFRL